MPLKSKRASSPIANLTRKPMSVLRVGTLSGLIPRFVSWRLSGDFSVLFIPLRNQVSVSMLVVRCLLSAY